MNNIVASHFGPASVRARAHILYNYIIIIINRFLKENGHGKNLPACGGRKSRKASGRFVVVYIMYFQEMLFSFTNHLYKHPLKSRASVRSRTRQYYSIAYALSRNFEPARCFVSQDRRSSLMRLLRNIRNGPTL